MKTRRSKRKTAKNQESEKRSWIPGFDRMDFGILVVLLIILGIRFALAYTVPIVSDETYYRLWANNIAWTYLDHPPMVAWLIFVSQKIFGTTAIGIRFFAPLLAFFGGWILYRTVRPDLRDASLWLVLGLNLCPIGLGAGIYMTPDAPFLFFLIACLALYRHRANDPRLWQVPLWGLIVGLGIISKLAMIPLFLLWYLQPPESRGTKLTLVFLLFIAIPVSVILFGGSHLPQSAFGFQIDRIFDISLRLWGPFLVLGSWMVAALPPIAIGIPYGIYGQFLNPTTMTLRELGPGLVAVVFVLLFTLSSILGHFEGNWLMPVIYCGSLGSLKYWSMRTEIPNAAQLWTLQALFSFVTAILMTLFIFLWPSLPDMMTTGMLRHTKWEETAHELKKIMDIKPGTIKVNHYEELSQFCYYLDDVSCNRLILQTPRGEALGKNGTPDYCLLRLAENDILIPDFTIENEKRFVRAYRVGACDKVGVIAE